jgi:hypothetical protein
MEKNTMKTRKSYLIGEEIKKYTVWVGGTEVTNNFITYAKAKEIYNTFIEQGYDDVIIESRRNR